MHTLLAGGVLCTPKMKMTYVHIVTSLVQAISCAVLHTFLFIVYVP